MRKVLALLLLTAPAACGSPSATGNELGGVIPWSGQSPASAFRAAEAHCKKFDRRPRITQVTQATSDSQGAVVFNCD